MSHAVRVLHACVLLVTAAAVLAPDAPAALRGDPPVARPLRRADAAAFAAPARGSVLPVREAGATAVVTRVVPGPTAALVQVQLAGSAVDASADESVWLVRAEGATPLLREGDVVPGWTGAVVGRGPRASPFGDGLDLLASDVNAAGHALVAAWLTTPGGVVPALLLARDGEVELLAVGAGPGRARREADLAPGLSSDCAFVGFRSGRLADDDAALVEATCTTAEDGARPRRGVWWLSPEGSELVMAEGESLPGRAGTTCTDVTLHAAGPAHAALFTAAAVAADGSPSFGAYRARRGRPAEVVLVEGETVLVGSGEGWERRVVRSFTLPSAVPGAAATVTFDDGTSRRLVVAALLGAS